MSKQFEELSKDLACGMSRRKAFARFAGGIGAAAWALLLRKPARGNGIGDFCVNFCSNIHNLRGREFGACVSDCVRGISTNINGFPT